MTAAPNPFAIAADLLFRPPTPHLNNPAGYVRTSSAKSRGRAKFVVAVSPAEQLIRS
jgi:hypothetical protein